MFDVYGALPFTGRVELWIYYHAKDRRKQDLDNRLKTILDSLEGVVIENDSQIDALHIYRGEVDPDKAGYCWLKVAEYVPETEPVGL